MSPETEVLEQLLEPVRACLTPEVAARLAALRASPATQKIVDDLAEKNAEGTITPAERAKLEAYVDAGALIAILQANARKVLADAGQHD
ncbi:MAG: hypothetical protein K2Y37_17115 [Pirellulales bacterium]|nr:hypothetical protein [Pirellulales bacterium]